LAVSGISGPATVVAQIDVKQLSAVWLDAGHASSTTHKILE